jgi:hypothetical protein
MPESTGGLSSHLSGRNRDGRHCGGDLARDQAIEPGALLKPALPMSQGDQREPGATGIPVRIAEHWLREDQ